MVKSEQCNIVSKEKFSYYFLMKKIISKKKITNNDKLTTINQLLIIHYYAPVNLPSHTSLHCIFFLYYHHSVIIYTHITHTANANITYKKKKKVFL